MAKRLLLLLALSALAAAPALAGDNLGDQKAKVDSKPKQGEKAKKDQPEKKDKGSDEGTHDEPKKQSDK